MRVQSITYIDNRDESEMYHYLEARVDVLRRRIAELETENRMLRCGGSPESNFPDTPAATPLAPC